MNRIRTTGLRYIVVVSGLCFGFGAMAEVYPGGLTSRFVGTAPATPLAGQPITLLLQSGPCEFLSDDRSSASILAISNKVVSVRIPGVTTSLCELGFSPREYDIPGLPAGTYRLDLTFYDVEQAGEVGEPAGYIGGRDISILPPHAPYAIPSSGFASLVVMCVLLACTGFRAMFSAMTDRFSLPARTCDRPCIHCSDLAARHSLS